MEHYADKPDLMTMAKSLAGGMPLSGVVGRAEIMDAPAPGGLGDLCRQPAGGGRRARGAEYYRQRVTVRPRPTSGRSTESHPGRDSGHLPCARGDKGRGSMIAAEFFDPEPCTFGRHRTGDPAKALAQGLLLLICGQYGNVIRFLYPLTIPDAQFTQALAILQQVMRDKT